METMLIGSDLDGNTYLIPFDQVCYIMEKDGQTHIYTKCSGQFAVQETIEQLGIAVLQRNGESNTSETGVAP